jgi:hypothetical protein
VFVRKRAQFVAKGVPSRKRAGQCTLGVPLPDVFVVYELGQQSLNLFGEISGQLATPAHQIFVQRKVYRTA